jgi:hypothetical protein
LGESFARREVRNAPISLRGSTATEYESFAAIGALIGPLVQRGSAVAPDAIVVA